MADCKRKTANLFDADTWYGTYKRADGTYQTDRNTWYSLVVKPFTNDDIGKSFCFAANVEPSSGNARFAAVINGVQINGRYTGNRCKVSFTVQTIDDRIIFDYGSGSTTITTVSNIMLNSGSEPLPYEPYGWVHSLRKLTTATDTFTTLPVDIYADGNNATVGISGNTVQNGTPTPDNPIMPQGTGERTGNLLNATVEQGSISISGDIPSDNRIRTKEYVNVESKYITLSWNSSQNTEAYIMMYDANGDYIRGEGWATSPMTRQLLSTIKKIRVIWRYESQADITPSAITNTMLNTGSTALPYEQYGYKIPISSASTTTTVYLGEVETMRGIYKKILTGEESYTFDSTRSQIIFYVSGAQRCIPICTHYKGKLISGWGELANGEIAFHPSDATTVRICDTSITSADNFKTYLRNQYAAGTPVCMWYILAESETAIVNEPLMKIGDYADTVSGITIPTITGKDTFDVQTTLKPSEVSLSYTGWHDATVEEWDGSQWQ